jgi:glycosyltransferase involved in cell wall biosynthesis
MAGDPQRLLMFAPGVRTGGGLVLLHALLSGSADVPVIAFVDARALPALPRRSGTALVPVGPGPFARLAAQRALARTARRADTVLCLHGLPPLLRTPARTVVLVQNRLLLERGALDGYPVSTRVRIAAQRRLGALLKSRVRTWFVQTPSMGEALRDWHGGSPDVRVMPFVADELAPAPQPGPAPVPADTSLPQAASRRAPADGAWDFVYVADGLPHKRHREVLEAWRLLAARGLRPSLAVTLGPRDAALAAAFEAAARREGLDVHNLGALEHEAVLALYGRARALLFASDTESFGLPLVEAARAGLPILAAERDFVRDVCVPAQTFDARSPRAIARADARHLGAAEPPVPVSGASAFLRAVLASRLPPTASAEGTAGAAGLGVDGAITTAPDAARIAR